MFPLGIFILFAGYAMAYTGIANLLNGAAGPTLSESLGFKFRLAPPGADKIQTPPVAPYQGQAGNLPGPVPPTYVPPQYLQ